VAAVCGLAAGLLEYFLSYVGGQAKVLIDVIVGLSTGVIAGLWFKYGGYESGSDEEGDICLSSVFLGTLYWFFYGTAFVIGLLEIIAGELETGVTRFVAVSVKTFVLSLGASLGLMLAVQGEASKTWYSSEENCNKDFVSGQPWRIPLYLLCSVAVLGQYRLPIAQYWQGLVIQLIAYEVQYLVVNGIGEYFTLDHLDTAASNIAGAAAGVVSACALSWLISKCRVFYSARLLQKEENHTRMGTVIYKFMRYSVKAWSCLGVGRQSDILKHDMEEKIKVQKKELNDPHHPRDRINLPEEEENLVLETIVSSQDINIWAILMPAVYQLVPGSIIARMWFNSIFPPLPFGLQAEKVLNSEASYWQNCQVMDNDEIQCENTIPKEKLLNVPQDSQESVFSNLMGKKNLIRVIALCLYSIYYTHLPSFTVISTSLSLGLIFGFAICQIYTFFVGKLTEYCKVETDEQIALRKRRQDLMEGMYTQATSPADDPSFHEPSEREEEVIEVSSGGDA